MRPRTRRSSSAGCPPAQTGNIPWTAPRRRCSLGRRGRWQTRAPQRRRQHTSRWARIPGCAAEWPRQVVESPAPPARGGIVVGALRRQGLPQSKGATDGGHLDFFNVFVFFRKKTRPREFSLLERKKTDKPTEGWEEDKVPTCTSRILEGRTIRDTGERERGAHERIATRRGAGQGSPTRQGPGIPLSYRTGCTRRHGGRRGPPTGCALS